MGEADLAGITRDGRRWELAFEDTENGPCVNVDRLRDVITMIEAQIALIDK